MAIEQELGGSRFYPKWDIADRERDFFDDVMEIDELLDNDEITSEEEGFLRGYYDY